MAEAKQAQLDTDVVEARTLTFTVPLAYQGEALGDVLIEVAPSTGRVRIERETFFQQMDLILNEAGQDALAGVPDAGGLIILEALADRGFDVVFDQNRLLLVLNDMPAEFRPVQKIGYAASRSGRSDLPTIDPASRSAYLNVNTNLDYFSDTDFETPEFFLDGATRFGNIVLEYDGAFTDQFDDDYGFFRRGVRAVYDQPDKQRRFAAGDLRINSLSNLRITSLGGISIEKGRRNFESFFPVARLGSQEIFLDTQSDVEVLINGEIYQTLNLAAGRYDLSDLPVQLGGNDIQLVVNDSAGRRQVIDYNFFFQPLDLQAGESEYTAAFGLIARNLTFEPDYSDDLAFVGNYRKAVTRSVILGGEVQLSEDLQLIGGTATVIPQFIPGGFDVEGSYSSGPAGSGVILQGRYRINTGNSFTNRQQISLNASYESENFQTLSDIFPITADIFTLNANFTRSLTERTFVNAGATFTSVTGQRDRSTYFADVVHRFNDTIRLTGGVEYGQGAFSGNDFGVRFGLSYAFGPRKRANVDYRSRTETLRATLSSFGRDEVGSIDYDVGFTDTRGRTGFDGSASYIGNRFDARLVAQTDGGVIGDVFDRQTARLQIGTSLAWADGFFGIGRPINDAFAVLKPDPAIGDIDVVSGRNLSGNAYDARSGSLGGAVQGNLVSYSQQSVQYDAASRVGIDIGDGVVEVDPPYRSGYAIKVGSSYFISAAGFLKRGDEAVALASGIVRAVDDEDYSPGMFFTNSAGRFAIIGLAPGGTYEITLSSGETFGVVVPEDIRDLYRMGDIILNDEKEP